MGTEAVAVGAAVNIKNLSLAIHWGGARDVFVMGNQFGSLVEALDDKLGHSCLSQFDVEFPCTDWVPMET